MFLYKKYNSCIFLFCKFFQFAFDLMVLGKMNDNKSIEEFVLVSKTPVETAAKLSKCFRTLAINHKEHAKDLITAGKW